MKVHYDYIIAGSGLAGLSLAYKIRQNPSLNHKSILLIDKDSKSKNDRTWCFWSKEEELFDNLVKSEWDNIYFATDNFERSFRIAPYKYKMIRGIDFYNHTLAFLKQATSTDFFIGNIESINQVKNQIAIKTTHKSFTSDYIFKSYPSKENFNNHPALNSHFVWQHFKGLIIETPNDSFDKGTAKFMDFRIPQGADTRFFYVMPISERKALIEIAIFSKDIPHPDFYDPFIKNYIQENLGITEYKISEEEIGAIPMTSYKFKSSPHDRIINIGTNSGSVKASSGFAFKRIQEETDNILKQIENNTLHKYTKPKSRFLFYDRILLNAILTGKTTGVAIFEGLFKNLSPQSIFKFLDEKGSFFHDLKIFTGPPTWPFFKAFLEEIFKK